MTQTLFGQYLKFVTMGHVCCLVGLMLASSLRGCMRSAPPAMPLMFTVEVPADEPAAIPSSSPAPRRAAEPQKEPSPVIPDRAPPSRPAPKAAAPRRGVQVSTNRVVRSAVPSPGRRPRSAFSEDELRRIEALLAAGATPSDRTTIPGEDDMCLIQIKNTLYNAWKDRPSLDEVGQATAEITLTFGPDGGVRSRKMSKRSGHAAMDESTLAAVNSVTRVEGLTREFLQRRNHEITVAFRLEGEDRGGL